MIHKIEFHISDFEKDLNNLPKTRADILKLARQAPAQALEVHILAVAADSDLSPSFELERIELVKTPDFGWRIQYLPEPWPFDIFKEVHSETIDIQRYLSALERGAFPFPKKIYSAETLNREGLGPEVRLDTRPNNRYPVFEKDFDAYFFITSVGFNGTEYSM